MGEMARAGIIFVEDCYVLSWYSFSQNNKTKTYQKDLKLLLIYFKQY